ncbi:hypothetical protein [Paracidobacterium acidisoli]|uniref:Uncharacterized protein n=1 Tax=Paracidobacterium acidisoli TaxID=2303751 RepID=A0A372IUM4_9BACT|nr:hypothetical protein [Paracidobacterium acidisoli]MBT9330065.1 hypothetical protein [Paracidobacterium acidisoli]
MSLTPIQRQIEANLPDNLAELSARVPWTSAFAAGTLVASAILLLRGKKKPALAVAAAGTVVALIDNADAARELWDKLPGYVRSGQDMLLKVEDFVEDLSKQGNKLREVIGRR